MHKISNRIFEIFFKKTLDFLLAGFRSLNLSKYAMILTVHTFFFLLVVLLSHKQSVALEIVSVKH